jgi:hypothetical protein
LNYYRSIQKRLALDLREFGTRDRVDSHLINPFTYSEEASKHVSRNASYQMFEKSMAGSTGDVDNSTMTHEEDAADARKLTVFDNDALDRMRNMASVRMYKVNGRFNSKVFSTTPGYPKFHTTFGEPTVQMNESEEQENGMNGGGVGRESVRLIGRIDKIEFSEEKMNGELIEEVYVKDDFGVYILYDCVLQDMKYLEDDLIKLGSYFISKQEVLIDPSCERPYPLKDRLEILADMVQMESKFQFRKVKLIQLYMECYEHICDPLEQQRIMQVITDIMARRPRIDLHAGYFRDSYTAENECLDAQFELLKIVLNT